MMHRCILFSAILAFGLGVGLPAMAPNVAPKTFIQAQTPIASGR